MVIYQSSSPTVKRVRLRLHGLQGSLEVNRGQRYILLGLLSVNFAKSRLATSCDQTVLPRKHFRNEHTSLLDARFL